MRVKVFDDGFESTPSAPLRVSKRGSRANGWS
jgi:hypothetical protein